MRCQIDGTYFENCNRDVVCPCSTSALTLPADNDRCNVAMAIHVRRGEINGVDVGGPNVFVVADTPAVLSEDVWEVGVLMDAAASPEAEAKFQLLLEWHGTTPEGTPSRHRSPGRPELPGQTRRRIRNHAALRFPARSSATN